jgi:hypothetical protein
MKKYYLIIAAFAAILACSKEPVIPVDEQEAVVEELTFTATAGEAFTKTTLSDLGGGDYDIVWETSDQIRITDGTNNAVYKPTNAAKQSPLNLYSGTEPVGPTFYAYYPSSLYNTGTGVFTLPENRTSYATGAFKEFPMYAQSDNTDLQFKNVCGLLTLALSGDGDARIGKVVVTANEYLSGPMTITEDSGAYKASLASGSKRVSVSFSSYKKLSEGVVVNIPLPAGTYTGLTIEVYPSAAGAYYSHKVANKGIVIARSQVTPITLTNIAFNSTALSKGDGTSVDPFQIETEADVIALGNACREGVSYTGKYLKVMNNITLTAPHKPFRLICAEFDGNDKTITLDAGFDLSEVASYAGFISQLTGTVKNLTLDGSDISIDASESVSIKGFGTVVGFDGTVRGCHNKINVSLTSSKSVAYVESWFAFGGVVGYPSAVYDSVNDGNITITLTNAANPVSYLGGVVGYGASTVSGCINNGTVYGDGVRNTGGVAGGNISGAATQTIDRCSNTGSVTGIYKFNNASFCVGWAGGIVASAPKGTITNCSNTGAVIAQKDTYGYQGAIILAGGIVGNAASSNSNICTVTNCYNTADIIARTQYDSYTYKPFAAGISGSNGNIINCYTGGTIYTKAWNEGYDNKSYGGGIIGFLYTYSSDCYGSVSYCYIPSQTLGSAPATMRTVGWKSRYGEENSTTTTKGEDAGGTRFDRSTLVTTASTTINAIEYPVGTNLVDLLNAYVSYVGGDLRTWKAGTGDPAYPVFN